MGGGTAGQCEVGDSWNLSGLFLLAHPSKRKR